MIRKDQDRILAIDQGTSGSKAMIFSLEGEILASRTEEYAISYPEPGFVEIHPADLLSSVILACKGVVEEYEASGGHRSDFKTIGISNQRESFLFWDSKGNPVSPVIVWQCKRSADFCQKLALDEDFSSYIRKTTGLVIDPYFSGTKAAVAVRDNQELQQRLLNGEILFGTVDSWLIWNLTDGHVHATDYTNACRTMLFDLQKLTWDELIIKRFGLDGLKLPEARPSDAGFGTTNLGGLLSSPVSIGSVIGDSHAAAFGEGLFHPGEAKVTLGTGSSILMNSGSEPVSSENGMVSTICWSSEDRIDYALEGIVVSCGSTINWVRDKMGLIADSREIDTLAEEISDPQGVYVIPGFSGIGAPWWKLDAKASIIGLDFGHDRRHIARAVLESISYQVADVLNAMAADTGGRVSAIKADGGITISRTVMRSLANLAGCPVQVPTMKQASAWGAALAAGLNAGLYSGLAEIDRLISSRETTTIKNTADSNLDERYAGWRNVLQDY